MLCILISSMDEWFSNNKPRHPAHLNLHTVWFTDSHTVTHTLCINMQKNTHSGCWGFNDNSYALILIKVMIIYDKSVLWKVPSHKESCCLNRQNIDFHLFCLLIFGDCETGRPTACSSMANILTQPHFTASIILSPVTNLSKVDSIPELLPFLSPSFLQLHLSHTLIKTHFINSPEFNLSVHLLTASFCSFSLKHFLSLSISHTFLDINSH